MSELKTIFLFKDGERIRVNDTDMNRFRKDGWEPEPEPEPVKPEKPAKGKA